MTGSLDAAWLISSGVICKKAFWGAIFNLI